MARFSGGSGGAGVPGPQGPAGPAGATGPVGATWRGQWETATIYYTNDLVEYNGSTYIALLSGFGTEPDTDPLVWELVAAAGEAGPQGEPGADGADATLGLETSFVVNGGTTGTQPTFNGAPLFSGSYIKNESLVHFQIQVDMDNITSFGTGQYFMDLPFPAKYGYMFREGCLHDIDTDREYHISGHVYAGQSQMLLFTTDVQGNRLNDFAFAQGEPITLSTADNFHISGSYIAENI